MADGLEALPCPFCGAKLQSKRDRLGYTYTHQHPSTGISVCLLSGFVFGGERTGQWNSVHRLGMDIVDGGPVFNLHGAGRPVTAAMINETILYYKRETK